MISHLSFFVVNSEGFLQFCLHGLLIGLFNQELGAKLKVILIPSKKFSSDTASMTTGTSEQIQSQGCKSFAQFNA